MLVAKIGEEVRDELLNFSWIFEIFVTLNGEYRAKNHSEAAYCRFKLEFNVIFPAICK